MGLGKSIRIYLKDGNVTGIKLAEVVNWTIHGVSCPRNKVSDLSFDEQNKKPGVYFLLGIDDQTNKPKVYIGEAENVYKRLQKHVSEKDFWNDVIFFTSKDENLTKSHVKYLESRLLEVAIDADRYVVDNPNSSNASALPLPDQDAMEEFILNIKLLIGVLGHKLLERVTSPTTVVTDVQLTATTENYQVVNTSGNLELFLSSKGLKASALQTNEGLVVLEGSDVAESITKNLQNGYKDLREDLISNNIIKSENDKLTFVKNHLFSSPSAAAAIIVGYSINGRNTWKNAQGKTLKDIEKEKIKAGNNG